MAIDIVEGIFSLWSQNENASYQKYMTKLKQQQLELDKGQTYNQTLSTLIDLASSYDMLGVSISAGQSYYDEQKALLDRWQGNYDYQMAQAQLSIDQQRNSLAGLFSSNIGQFNQGMEGLALQQVALGERGQSGSTARLLGAIQKQELINFAGTDLTLDAEGGTYGALYNAQQSALDTAVMGKSELEKDLQAQRQTYQNNMGIATQTINALTNARNLTYNSLGDALASAIKQGHYAGETYDDLGKMIDSYRQYLTVDDKQYAELKANLLQEWKPIDFEIRTATRDWDNSGEGENHEGSVSYYQIYDKATGKLASQEQIENILRNYAGNLNEKDWYSKGQFNFNTGWVANSGGLSEKAIKTIMKNSNYDKRKDYK